MNYKNIKIGEFIDRPNRFIAHVLLDGEAVTVHVKNTGRCKELLKKGSKVYLSETDNPERKTKYDLIAVQKVYDDGRCELVNIDSQAPNTAAYEWLKKGELFSSSASVRREVTYGDSRFDLYIEDGERRAFIEVKGVTLERGGFALFPDAPTERGIKHVSELAKSIADGYEAYVLFVIQMKGVHTFSPNDETHKAFGDALRNAYKEGVKILAYDCIVTEASIEIDQKINVEL
ncbi:MAG: DNA/RNA nuclease SfsA [Clostridia bacterium]|nr:DNA/RNA nuclease SfsA [Clostridia bacterium]